jgi:hypothetical protein
MAGKGKSNEDGLVERKEREVCLEHKDQITKTRRKIWSAALFKSRNSSLVSITALTYFRDPARKLDTVWLKANAS